MYLIQNGSFGRGNIANFIPVFSSRNKRNYLPYTHEKVTTIKKPAGKEFYQDVVEWDVPNWSRAIDFWDSRIPKYIRSQNPTGLDLGARDGGLSLYLAARHNVRTVCSDLGGPSAKAREMHIAYGVDHLIEYADVNAFHIPYPNNTFDIVIFKSLLPILGSFAHGNSRESQAAAVREFYRVLKPGGTLLFAENLKASGLHAFVRRKFVPWGVKCRYVTVPEMKEFLTPFSHVEYETFGFLGALAPTETLKRLIYPIERMLNLLLPETVKYIIYGVAVK